MEKKTSFTDLRTFLEGLGFSETAQPTHFVFEHPGSGSLLMFRRYRARDAVTPANLAAVRKLLDERGLLPADEFDNLEWKPTVRNASCFAQQTVKGARNFCDVKLDYSPSSVRKVDKIIGQFRREGPDVEDVAETLFGLGCYVGEVFVRNAGGKWKADPSSPFGLVIRLDKDSFCDPIAKAFKRFENGAGDSLAYFYQCFAEMTHGED